MMLKLIKSLLRITFAVIIGIPLLLYPWLYFNQQYLLFPGFPINPENYQLLSQKHPQGEQKLTVHNNIQLHGWLADFSSKKPAPLLIYFGGNAEDACTVLFNEDLFQSWMVLAMNYQGYGYSQGQPSEQVLFADALMVYDQALQRFDVDPARVVVMGRSLGSGVAVYLAAHRPVKQLILVTPYDSIERLAQGFYPYAPVKWLLKHHFNVLPYAKNIQSPVLALLASDDESIPKQHSQRLLNAWAGKKQILTIADSGHNDLIFDPQYQHSIQTVLSYSEDLD